MNDLKIERDIRILITGATGFVGSHLLETYLSLTPKPHIFATKRWRSDMSNVAHIEKEITWLPCDLTDPSCTNFVIQETQPDIIHHLAAMSYVKYSFDMPADAIFNNLISSVNLLEAVRSISPSSTVLLTGSSEEYGVVAENELPISETNPTRPASPYGISKLAQTQLGWIYAKGYGLDVILTRAFNHSGPRRSLSFILPKIILQGIEIQQGKRNSFELGNLDAYRDFTHVKDICRAYIMLALKGNSGEVYNICSGTAYSIKEIIDKVKKLLDIDVGIKTMKSNFRPLDVPFLLGDNTKIKKEIGWKPKFTLDDILRDIYNWLRGM